jgi:class 3 adenylate cyclase
MGRMLGSPRAADHEPDQVCVQRRPGDAGVRPHNPPHTQAPRPEPARERTHRPATFLFTDIEGSTRLWEQQPEAMRVALAAHDATSRRCVQRHGGRLVKSTGDGIHAVFTDPVGAVLASVALQRALADAVATHGVELRIRCGVHVGADHRRDDDFFGNAVNRAARIMSVAHGGQVLLSAAVASLVADRLPPDTTLRDLGSVRLRDLSRPERVFQVVHPRLRDAFPALRSLEATPNNLPQQLTSFIGREHEVATVCRLLRETRLLTLVGGGGSARHACRCRLPRRCSPTSRTERGSSSSRRWAMRGWSRRRRRRCWASRRSPAGR